MQQHKREAMTGANLLIVIFSILWELCRTQLMTDFCSLGGNCFIFSEVKTSNVWDAAEYCSEKNAVLGELSDESARLEMVEVIQPLLRVIRKQEPFLYLGMNDMFHEGKWVLQDGKLLDTSAISGRFNDTDNDCSAILTDTYTIVNVPCVLPRNHSKVHFLCQVKESLGCYNEAPDYVGFNKVSTTNGREYGSIVTYSCSGIHYYSRCFGSLGWDIRDMVKRQCKESKVKPTEQKICNYNERESVSGMVQRIYKLNAVQLAQQASWNCYKDSAEIQARFDLDAVTRLSHQASVCCFVTLYGNITTEHIPEVHECSNGFEKIANKCFQLFKQRVTNAWHAADMCYMEDAVLAEIPDRITHEGIITYLRKQNMNGEIAIFLGMNDIREEGRWELYNGTVLPLPGEGVYTPLSHKVDNWMDAEDCSSIQPTEGYLINDIPCTIQRGINDWPTFYPADLPFLCEIKRATKCSVPPPSQVSGYTLQTFDPSLEYGGVASYSCSGRTAESRCYGTLGWDVRDLDQLYCEEAKEEVCSEDFERLGNKCFRLFKDRVSNAWDAADRCYTKGAVLAEIPDLVTHEEIITYLRRENMNGEIAIFLGMNDIREEGTWRLYNETVLPLPGEGVYTPLSRGVDNWMDAEDCSSIQPTEDYIINDIPCTIQRGVNDWPTFYPADLPYLCELKGPTKCSLPPPSQVSGFTLEKFDPSLEYGSVASYRCSRRTVESRCYGTLGWDVRNLDQLYCEEAKEEVCTEGFERIANKCFLLFKERVTNAWAAADMCYTKGAVLAEIPDLITHEGIIAYLRRESMNGEVAIFLGMNDIREEGKWELYNGTVLPLPGEGVYTPLSHKLDNWMDAEDCSSIQPTEGYLINDIPCTIQRGVNDWPTFYPADLPFICEMKGTTKCSTTPAQEVSGFRLNGFNKSLEYGSSANYKCSERSFKSHCFGTLGWDIRELDQLNCEGNLCTEWQKQCDDGSCFHYSRVCNGKKDCPDGSDEKPEICASHKKNCSYYEFPCFDGTCVFETDACNGKEDCPDGSDEDQMYCESCGGANFLCPDGSCISKIKMCDTMNDCDDGADEVQATCAKERCEGSDFEHSYFGCKSGPCILGSQVCDGTEDCWDGEDETLRKCRYVCEESEFQCVTWGICIPGNRTCDGEDDCFDGGSDEQPGFCEDCGMRYKCSNGRCIPMEYLCDGNHNCDHDEVPNICKGEELCGKGQFLCDNENCISATLMCNKEDDCGDNSDEPELCNMKPWYVELMEDAERIRNG